MPRLGIPMSFFSRHAIDRSPFKACFQESSRCHNLRFRKSAASNKCGKSRIYYLAPLFHKCYFSRIVKKWPHLSRRERQIIDILYKKGRATAAEVMEDLPDPPGYSAVRSLLATLEQKGHVHHEKDGAKYVFIPTVHPDSAKRSAIRHLIQTFFGGSRENEEETLMDVSPKEFSEDELKRLAELIEKARKARKR